ncbi:FGGY-family carbohydrate kinase [Mangrovibrevibacter kandeliae]|uniref:FGGY-family carbohydrate kinase n=1 Tax=Mangrovibrevibacter kandeliae TaxID=2968473 RepID=UPI0021173BFF|nr:FGGY-family carbohydrate kinase [Aurantimonas sp. CSK15Z-1]MCQ8781233.1 FGGY-family carbohydrate kinase [Aurantimonas sp. CSK15Z-1]
MASAFLGVDVGTGSARAGLFAPDGTLLASARRPIRIWREPGEIVEQSSHDIWRAVAAAVHEAMATAGLAPGAVRGIGFDATCSLVVVDADGAPLPVGPSGDPNRNVVVWMDHRALDQTARINASGHPVLRYVGGRMSPEMQAPKLLWLKEKLPDTFARAGHFFDLADWLSFRATGSTTRSVCTTTCKWTYLAHQRRWDASFFRTVGLGDFVAEDFARIGPEVLDIATPLGAGLSEAAAAELGLSPGTPVGASLIDAHAGGVGTLGGRDGSGRVADPLAQLAFIMGTSSCTMSLTHDAVFVEGVWGPYCGAMMPGYWLLEGGQSAFGAALDHLVQSHPAHAEASERAAAAGCSVLDLLERRAIAMAGTAEAAAHLAVGLHVVPDFLGNRSPAADPKATAAIAGLTLDTGLDGLARLFVAGLCGLCYGTRQIVAANRAKGVTFGTIVAAGGAARSPLLRRILADATGIDVALPATPEPVLLGSAIVGAVAGGAYPDIKAAAAAMGRTGPAIKPQGGEVEAFHARKFAVFERLQAAEREAREIMGG